MNQHVTALLQDAAEWRLLSILFEYPGDGWRERLTAILPAVGDPQMRAAGEAALREAYPGMHHSIFGPGGPVSPREVSYTSGVQLGYLLSEIAAFYDAFAYTYEASDPADHVSVEAGFIAYLRLKQAYALACGEQEKASIAADASSEFLREHLSRMAEPIAAKAAAVAPSYLAAAAQMLCARTGPARRELGTLPVLDDEEAVQCG